MAISLKSEVAQNASGINFTRFILSKNWIDKKTQKAMSFDFRLSKAELLEAAKILSKEAAFLQFGDPAKNFV